MHKSRIAVASLKAFRDVWLMFGIALALCIFAELLYRGTVEARKAVARWTAPEVVADPQAETDWIRGYMVELPGVLSLKWRPYVYFRRRPFVGLYSNVDALGHRVVPLDSAGRIRVAKVFLFGGSTMWGAYQRDSNTIAAVTARRLQSVPALGPGAYVALTNFGEIGHVFTQELIELILQLRAGNRPDVVLFYDGVNDVVAVVQNGVAGFPQNEARRASEFAMGQRLNHSAGIANSARALLTLSLAAVRESELAQRLRDVTRPAGESVMISADSGARSIAQVYAENVRIVEALSKAYDFRTIYVWQPALQVTPKPLSAFENHVVQSLRGDTFWSRLREIHRAVVPLLGAAIPPLVGSRFVDASELFQNDSTPVFLDAIGHNTEASNPAIVAAFWPILSREVSEVLVRTAERRNSGS